jgi:hypothetical protein
MDVFLNPIISQIVFGRKIDKKIDKKMEKWKKKEKKRNRLLLAKKFLYYNTQYTGLIIGFNRVHAIVLFGTLIFNKKTK